MPELRYCYNQKTIYLNIGDLILFRSEEAKKDYPFFGKVHEIQYSSPERSTDLILIVSLSLRLIVDQEFGGTPLPRYVRSVSDPAQYRAHLITDIWAGRPKYLARRLIKNFEYMGPWAKVMKKMKPPYNFKPLEKVLST